MENSPTSQELPKLSKEDEAIVLSLEKELETIDKDLYVFKFKQENKPGEPMDPINDPWVLEFNIGLDNGQSTLPAPLSPSFKSATELNDWWNQGGREEIKRMKSEGNI